MTSVAYLPIVADRYGPLVRHLYVAGLDLTGVTMRAQVRFSGDSPGSPYIDLLTVTNGNAQGLRLVDVTTDDHGLPTSHVEIVINETTMEGLPYAGELGDAVQFAWDMQITIGGRKRRLAKGEFEITGDGVTGADASPINRPIGYGRPVQPITSPWKAARLSFGEEQVTVQIVDAELVAPLVKQAGDAAGSAADSRDKAALSAGAAQGAARYFTTRAAGEAASATDQAFATDDGAGSVIYYRRTAGGSVEIGRAVTPAALAADDGTSRLGFRSGLPGSVFRTQFDRNQDWVSVKDLGAKGDAFTNDTIAIDKAIESGKSVFFPTGVYPYTPSAKTLAIGQYLYGESPLTTRIAKVSSGDMFTMAAGSGMSDIGLQGNGSSSVTGRGVLLPANTANVTLTNVNVLDFEGYCVEATAANGGSQLRIIGGLYARTDVNLCAIKLPDHDTQASPRQFVGANSTGWLVDTSGADNTIMTGCYCRNMIHGPSSKKTLVSGCRFGTIEGDYTIAGIDHAIVGNAMAGRIVLSPGTQTSFVKANVNVLGALDNSGNSTNQTDFSYYGSRVYDPVSMPNGGGETFDVQCPGAKPGMFVQATFSESLSGALLAAYIATADTVTVRIINNTGGDLNLPNGTFRVGARQL